MLLSSKNINTLNSFDDQKMTGNTEGNDVRQSAEEMDLERQKLIAYEYLCHLEEAKNWIEACIKEKLPPTTELEENLRNGVYLAKLAHFMDPKMLPLSKIYDARQQRYEAAGLQFRHTDNINHFLKCLRSMQLPLTFQPETTDIYDKKNMPRVIYCIHALSTHLFKLGKAPQIQDLYGKVNFTDAEIDAVSRELKKYGISMPAFQKIGGLMTSCMEGDTAALHAATIAINECLSSSDSKTIFESLKNPAARLKNIIPEHVTYYYETLKYAKDIKTQAALNRSLNDSYVPDAYDELLTPAEIQGHINNVNATYAIKEIMKSLNLCENKLVTALSNPTLAIQNICFENVEFYKEKLAALISGEIFEDEFMDNYRQCREYLQEKINDANEIAEKTRKVQKTVDALNETLEHESYERFKQVLMSSELGLNDCIDKFALPLYYSEMKIDRAECKNNLVYSDIVVSIRVLSAIAYITKAVDTGAPGLTYQALCDPEAHIMNLEAENEVKYYRALVIIRSEKKRMYEDCNLLTYIDIQECIDVVNQQCSKDNQVIAMLEQLNRSVLQNDRMELISALTNDALKLQITIFPGDASLYMKIFKKCLNDKQREGSELWLEDVENVVRFVSDEADQVQTACNLLSDINRGLHENDLNFTIECLEGTGLHIPQELRSEYFTKLKDLSDFKRANFNYPYVRYVTPQGNESYLDLNNHSYTWESPKKVFESSYLSKEDIEDIIKEIHMEDYEGDSVMTEKTIINFQAASRGYLLRKKLADRLNHFHENIDKIVKIQAWWRGVAIRNIYARYLQPHRKDQKDMRITHKNTFDRYREQVDKIIKIQAMWRGRIARRAFHSLLRLEKPPFPVVRHFSSILNFNAEDYDKDLQLQQLKNDVVQTIRHNQKLSQQLDEMDIKIGLLIQNRITLQDVIAHGKNLESLAKDKNTNRLRKNSMTEIVSTKGLKSLTKDGRKMLEGYQHLFYALQTNPAYLSKLLLCLPQSKTNKFLQNVIFTLFNFGSNSREEYLLLKLFGRALEEEIKSKFQKPSEVVTGNPLVLKMVVNYARQLDGQSTLRKILGPIIERVLADKTISIETNPVDIYKCWRNQLEMDTGETLNLPYSVSQQQALTYEPVRKRLSKGMDILQNMVLEFLKKITESRDMIPYGMLYMAKVLHDTLSNKFPRAPEKDILKVVGNLIYYQFINAAIVAPDAFEIITLPIERSLSTDQRRNLASIAKILQFAASKKGFGEEAPHLMCLNPFIIECHERFKNFFRSCCEIESLDEHFHMHQYTEATLIHKPDIYISLEEICDTHSLLLEYCADIVSGPDDPLHELLNDLHCTPTIASLLGITDPKCEANITRMGKTEVCLVLTNKFEVPENDDQNLNKLFIKTKELLVSVLQFLKGETLVEALETTSLPAQQKLYDAKYSSMMNSMSLLNRSSSLNDCKIQLRAYLYKLESGKWLSQSDAYQSIVTAVAKDLCNKGKYRVIRNKELQTLRATKQRLQEKTKYYQEQVDYYNEYTQRCLENLHTGKGSLRAVKMLQKNNHGKLKSKNTLKYTAAKLHEKGILLEIDGLSHSQFKNVLFEISPTESNGIFTIRGKFMGVEMEKIDIDIQNLLKLQFEGAPIMDIFGKAKINVNLLLYLLNLKFYGKT